MKIPVIVGVLCLAAVLVVGMFTTNFTSYLGNDPTTCNNCHVMDAAYEGWYHAPHKLWATCVDCHTPHAFIPKYFIKAKHGAKHVTLFTLNLIPEPIRASTETKGIVQANCIRCHAETISEVADGKMDSGRYCFDCHKNVAHGERGITILPYQDKGIYQLPD